MCGLDIHAQKLKKRMFITRKKIKTRSDDDRNMSSLSLSLDIENFDTFLLLHTYLTVLSPRFCYTWISNGSPQIRKSSSPQTHSHSLTLTINLKIQKNRVEQEQISILYFSIIYTIQIFIIYTFEFLQFFLFDEKF